VNDEARLPDDAAPPVPDDETILDAPHPDAPQATFPPTQADAPDAPEDPPISPGADRTSASAAGIAQAPPPPSAGSASADNFAQAPPPPSTGFGSPSGPGSWGSATPGAFPGSGGGLTAASGVDDSRTWALGAHVSALVGGLLGGLPAFVGPLVVWLTRRDTDPFAAEHGREALNFNLSVALYAIVLIGLTVLTLGFGLILSLPLGIGLGGYWLVASIVAAVRAGNGEPFRYPLTIPFVS